MHPDSINPGELMDKLRLPGSRRVFASMYNNVLLTTDVAPIKNILVCAADEGEGATTVALGLALAAAEQQTGPVLLIDGNFRKPAVLAAFGQKDLYDRVFLVIHAGETRAPVVTAALSKLAANGCDKVELLLNRRIFPIPQWIYKKL